MISSQWPNVSHDVVFHLVYLGFADDVTADRTMQPWPQLLSCMCNYVEIYIKLYSRRFYWRWYSRLFVQKHMRLNSNYGAPW